MTAIKAVQISDNQIPQGEFSQPSKNGEKIASESDSEKTSKAPGNMGLPAIPGTPLGENSEEQPGTPACEKKKGPSKQKTSSKPKASHKPLALASPGPEGYKIDVVEMTAGQLQTAYASEYQTWKNRKHHCKKNGWPWASEWEGFKDFLLSIGPKPSPAHTLERIDNAVQAYGPALCKWASKVEQNNNKSDNHKIVEPVTGKVWTPKQLAKLHGKSDKTVYKWISQNYSALELLAGKKSKPLHALWVKLDELPAQPPKGKKVPVRPLKLPEFKYPYTDEDWPLIDADWDYYQETGEVRNTHYPLYRAEYDAVATWMAIVNAGLTVPAFPQLKYYKILPPTPEQMKQLHLPLPPKPKPSPPKPWAPKPSTDDYDPADCMPDPNDEKDPTECLPPNEENDHADDAVSTSLFSKFPLKTPL